MVSSLSLPGTMSSSVKVGAPSAALTSSVKTPAPDSLPLTSAKSDQAAKVAPPIIVRATAMPAIPRTVLRMPILLVGEIASEGGRFRHSLLARQGYHISPTNPQIGRASCRERVGQYW